MPFTITCIFTGFYPATRGCQNPDGFWPFVLYLQRI